MADYGLFIGWGFPQPGREAATLKVFQEAVAHYSALQAAGEIESFESALLARHGGDLGGFTMLRGDAEKLDRVRRSPEFLRLIMRAEACLDHVGVVDSWVDAGMARLLGTWQEAVPT